VVSAAGDRVRERLRVAAQRYAALAHELAVEPDEAARVVWAALDDAVHVG
jgi:hypothetical protein